MGLGLAPQLRQAPVEDPPASASRSAGVTAVHHRTHLPWGFWHCDLACFTVCTRLRPTSNPRHCPPTQPLNLTFCGVHLLTTHSGSLTCCWLGRLLFVQCEHTGARRYSQRADTAVADGIAIFSGITRTGFPRKCRSLEPLWHSSSVRAPYKEGGSPWCPQQAWGTVPLPCDQKL